MHFADAQSNCRAAVRQIDITPPVGIYHRMWGAAAHDRSTGVHRPLTATVMVLQSLTEPELRWIAAAVDHCLLWHDDMQTMLARIAAQADVPQGEVTVFFSHTHAAGLMGSERANLPGGDLIAPYMENVATQIAGAISSAIGDLQPATFVYGTGKCGLGTNRDLWDAEKGHFVCGFNPAGAADDTLVVARLTSQTNEILGTIVNYACHPTTLAWDNTEISPDYVGAMREVVEQQTSAPCFFIQGASGDVGPRDGYVGDAAVADRNGRQLGFAALSTLESLLDPRTRLEYTGPVVSGATIGTWAAMPFDAPCRDLFQVARRTIELPFRADMDAPEILAQRRDQHLEEEQAAREADDTEGAATARAMAERMTRRIAHLSHLPDGDVCPYEITVYRLGDALWIPLDGEHYNVLQRQLRQRFPNRTLVIGTLANGSDVWYLPDESSYGKGLYQEDASVLAQGSLEQLTAAIGDVCEQLIREDS